MGLQTIYIALLKEGTDVWAPVDAENVEKDLYRIVDCRGAEAEFEFGQGSLVRCRFQRLSGGEELVAFEAAPKR